MDGKLFEEWLRELLRMFAFEGRNVTFVIDSCPGHPHIDNLKAITLYFLPPNTTSKTQPMDQGVIRSLKAKYRNKALPISNFVAARNANVSFSLGCTIDANDRELLSKVWNIHRKPGNRWLSNRCWRQKASVIMMMKKHEGEEEACVH